MQLPTVDGALHLHQACSNSNATCKAVALEIFATQMQ